MKITAPEKVIYGMTDRELQAAIDDIEMRLTGNRNLLAELQLHRMMRKHVKREHLKDRIRALQDQLEASA